MQDIHCIGGGGIFAEGGGDRRLRPIHHEALNCPRCDSLNTKFCYYNNYNLSQPRHYCKSCRRYWTKGGVLRNVPVGGGCRKAKRVKPKSAESAVTAAPEQERKQHRDRRKSNSHSGSEGSSLTAANSNLAVVIDAVNSSAGGEGVTGNPNSGLGEESLEGKGADCGLFSEIGNFSTSNETTSFDFGMSLNQHGVVQVHEWQNQNQNQQGGRDIRGSVRIDQTAQSRSDGSAFGSFDWIGNGNQQGLFDFTNAVDHTYWSQHHQWIDQAQHSFYLP